MKQEDYVKIFEDAACKQTYNMEAGVKAVVTAAIDHIHDDVIDYCESDEECRQEIVNYRERVAAGSDKRSVTA